MATPALKRASDMAIPAIVSVFLFFIVSTPMINFDVTTCFARTHYTSKLSIAAAPGATVTPRPILDI
jgi:hypothetical protein